MTPPRTPDHETDADQIVDMTPTYTAEEDAQEIVDMSPRYQSEGEPEEIGDDIADDMTPAYAPDDEAPEMEEFTPPYRPSRGQQSLPATAPHMPGRKPGEPQADHPKAKGNRRKLILMAAAGIAVVAVAGKTLGQSFSGGNNPFTGGSKATSTTSVSATNTPKPVQIGNNQFSSTPGPLILLNPGVVRQGTAVGVTGSGFDPGAVIDLTVKRAGSATALASTFVQADKGGTFYSGDLAVPMSLSSGTFTVQAKQRNSHHTAQAVGTIAGGAPTVKLGTQVGKPGDNLVLALHGFAPGEPINVYWNTLSGQPVTTFQADGGGSIGQGKLRVPFGAVGNNTFLFVGAKSQSLVAANYLVLKLYPTVKLGSYALKADNLMSFSGSGFGPSERVFVFLNSTNGQPLGVINTDAVGSFKNAPGFIVPFNVTGKQTLIFMGEQSRAPNAVSFTILPYAPIVQASTYGGLPGTTVTFYGAGFARNEVVHVYVGHTKGAAGNLVSCFQVNDKGAAASAGSYLIPGNAQGALGFTLVGMKSKGVGVASVNVSAPPAPVTTPPQAPFTCPLDSQVQQTPTQQPPAQQPPGQQPPGQQPPDQQAPGQQPPNQQAPDQQQQNQQPPNQQAPDQQAPANPAPQGNIKPPVQQPIVYAPASNHLASASLALAALPRLPIAQLSAHAVQVASIGLLTDLYHHVVWSFPDQIGVSSFVVGLVLAWFVLVLFLTLSLMHGSAEPRTTDDKSARRTRTVTNGHSPAPISTKNVANHDIADPPTLPSGLAVHSAVVEAHARTPAADTQYQQGKGSDLLQVPAVRADTGRTIQAAQQTARRHSQSMQPSYDATFAQTNVKRAGEESTFSLFLVADAKGDGRPGPTASQIAVEHIARCVITALTNGPIVPSRSFMLLFKQAVMQAGDILLKLNARDSTDANTTLTGALIAGERAYVVNVGNSRTYLWSAVGGLRQLTRDHSVVFGMVSAGLVGAEAIEASPHGQQLYRSLGNVGPPIQVDTFTIPIHPGDRLLLCSDGLWRQVRNSHIEAILWRSADPREAAQTLIHAANERSPKDDISAIVVHLFDGDSYEGRSLA